MNQTSKIRLLTIVSVLSFWLSHWMAAEVPARGAQIDWIIVGVVLMLLKTLPLWLFVFIIRENRTKVFQYLSFAALFYMLVGFWNLFDPIFMIGVVQMGLTGYLLWILVQMGRKSKQAFKAQKKAQELENEQLIEQGSDKEQQ